jgi:metal-sulfur cluster biosynthetic enzyme
MTEVRAASSRSVGPPTVEAVTGLLRGVIDPELGGNIVDLGMVPSVAVAPDGAVTVYYGKISVRIGS